MDDLLESTSVPLMLLNGRTTYLRLQSTLARKGGREVALIACNDLGQPVHRGSILDIETNGTLNLRWDINKEIGLNLTPRGRIILD